MMARAHKHIIQSGEMVFLDSTSSLDRYNTSVFILSAAHPGGGIPLRVILSSDEKEETITAGLKMLKEVLPKEAFHNNGPHNGPGIWMTDDSQSEKGALRNIWPSAVQLLCTFHFLQRRWTWLWEGKHHINNTDRVPLIKCFKQLVYARSESQLEEYYKSLQQSQLTTKYPHFKEHVQSFWPKRKEWALCFRKGLPVRDNHTNNVSEAGVRILKDLVFGRVKAYNLVQMFRFATEVLEIYHQRKLLSIANNRIDHYVSVKFQGKNATKISKEHITEVPDDPDQFLVQSTRDPDQQYLVDTAIGVCSCEEGKDGSPCSHQHAVYLTFGRGFINSIPTLQPILRRELAKIAIGERAVKELSFYASVTQVSDESTYTPFDPLDGSGPPNFSGSCWAIIREGAKVKIQNDPQLRSGVERFVARYNKMSESNLNALLASSFHRFGWSFGGSITSMKGGALRRGKRIAVQAASAGRRKYGSRGKARVTAGKPVKLANNKENLQPSQSRFTLPTRRAPKGKRPHDLSLNISKNVQNAGKW